MDIHKSHEQVTHSRDHLEWDESGTSSNLQLMLTMVAMILAGTPFLRSVRASTSPDGPAPTYKLYPSVRDVKEKANKLLTTRTDGVVI